METNKPIYGHLAAFFTIFVWGLTFISTRVLLGAFSPLEIMFYRLIMAILALCIISPPWPGKSEGQGVAFSSLKEEWKPMLAGLFGVTLYFIFQNVAMTYTLTANVGVIVSIAPLLIALISRALFGERLKGGFLFGFAAAMTGILLIAFNGSVVLRLNPLGDLLAVLAALVWACYSVLIKIINAPQGAVFALTRKVFLYGFLFMLPLLPLFEFRLGLGRLAVLPNLLHLLFLGVLASALCFATWNFAVHMLGPVKTSVYIYMVPLITILASALVLREPITPLSALGMALILAGMFLSEREKAS